MNAVIKVAGFISNRWMNLDKQKIGREINKLRFRGYMAINWLVIKRQWWGKAMLALIFVAYVLANIYVWPALQNALETRYATEQSIGELRSLIQNIGVALMGAVVIVVPVMLLAIHVNFERVPYRFFLRLSADKGLLSLFGLAFLSAISVIVLPIFSDQSTLACFVLSTFAAAMFIFLLFLYSYRRALFLINPMKQLEMLAKDAKNELQKWARIADLAATIAGQHGKTADMSLSTRSTHDLVREEIFRRNSHWTNGPIMAVRHAMSLAQRYAELEDRDVVVKALNSILNINKAYIKAKGRTFHANNPLIDNPQATDEFISEVLDQLRKNAQSGIFRRNEDQIRLTLETLATLFRIYHTIDYSEIDSPKTHADIAVAHLVEVVELTFPCDMPNILLEGQRLIAQSANHLLRCRDPKGVVVLSEKIRDISLVGCLKETHRRVIMGGLTQLTRLNDSLLRSGNSDDREVWYVAMKIHQDFSLVAKSVFERVPDSPISNNHRWHLSSYYSQSNTQSLRVLLEQLTDVVIQADSDDKAAQKVIRNIERWTEGILQTEKSLLHDAVRAKSSFTFDMVGWTAFLAIALLQISSAPSCEGQEEVRESLRKQAGQVINALASIPDNEDTKEFIRSLQMTDTLFAVADDARNLKCDEVAERAGRLLLSWAFRYGGSEDRWSTMGQGLFGAAVLACAGGDGQVEHLIDSVKEKKNSYPEQPIMEMKTAIMRWNTYATDGHRY